MMGGAPSPNRALTIGPDRLQEMNARRIDVEVLSINPFWYAVDRVLAPRLIRAQNEGLAAVCAADPDRFVGLATVALQHPDLAAEQLEEGVKTLGLRGGSVGASVGSEELASRRFDPFWAKAEELDVPLFLHPQGVPELEARLQGNGMLGNVIGNPLATTIALSHLIFEGTLDRFPRLKLCAAHGGGYLPSYADRSDYGCGTYVGLVAAFESLLGYFQPGEQASVVITTFEDDGTAHARVVQRLDSDGRLYVSANHWPRAWYRRAVEHPNVRATLDGETRAYRVVPVSGAEHDRVNAEHPHGIVFRVLTGFPPRRIVRLDPREGS